MRVKDFEKAIEALKCPVVLDEVKLSKGHVRRFFGHNGCTLIMWDESGRGFSCVLHTLEESEMQHDTHKGVVESCYAREPAYDLKFESSTEGM